MSKEERQRQIQEAAKEVFLEKGFNEATMADIIDKSAMSVGGVYHYYKDKYEILYDLMVVGNNKRIDKIRHSITGRESNLNLNMVANLLVDKILTDNEYNSIYVIFLTEIKNNERLKSLYEDLKEASINDYKNIFKDLAIEEPSDEIFEFLTNIVNSATMACEILGVRNNFKENRDSIVLMLERYFKEVSFIE